MNRTKRATCIYFLHAAEQISSCKQVSFYKGLGGGCPDVNSRPAYAMYSVMFSLISLSHGHTTVSASVPSAFSDTTPEQYAPGAW